MVVSDHFGGKLGGAITMVVVVIPIASLQPRGWECREVRLVDPEDVAFGIRENRVPARFGMAVFGRIPTAPSRSASATVSSSDATCT